MLIKRPEPPLGFLVRGAAKTLPISTGSRKLHYDIQDTIDYIIDLQKPARLRAIRFFELIVVFHIGESLAPVTRPKAAVTKRSSLIFDVDERLLKDFRILAAQKFLDQVETNWTVRNPDKKPTLERMVKVTDFSCIYDRVLLKSGSWRRMRYTDNLATLAKKLDRWKVAARDAARIVDFLVRYVPDNSKPNQVAGVTMAYDILTSGAGRNYFRTETKKTQLGEAWSRLQSVAPFHYLIYTQKFECSLDSIRRVNFATIWLNLVQDRRTLLEFFAAYNAVVSRLLSRRYHYTSLRLRPNASATSLAFSPISPRERGGQAVLDQIASYY